MEMKDWKNMAHYVGLSHTRPIVSGVLTVFYFNRLIALLGEQGQIVWRDPAFPLYLVEYLIENPPPQYRWN